MPMLALVLLFSSLFGDGSGPTEDALRSQILRTEGPQDTHEAVSYTHLTLPTKA